MQPASLPFDNDIQNGGQHRQTPHLDLQVGQNLQEHTGPTCPDFCNRHEPSTALSRVQQAERTYVVGCSCRASLQSPTQSKNPAVRSLAELDGRPQGSSGRSSRQEGAWKAGYGSSPFFGKVMLAVARQRALGRVFQNISRSSMPKFRKIKRLPPFFCHFLKKSPTFSNLVCR